MTLTVGENKASVAAASCLKLGTGGVWVLLNVVTDALAHHAVLSHDDIGGDVEDHSGWWRSRRVGTVVGGDGPTG